MYCECGCGKLAPIATETKKQYGHVKGLPVRFIQGHNSRGTLKGSSHPQWRGGRKKNSQGYISIWNPDHPRADVKGYVRENILMAEQALGKPLPPGAVVHHVNGSRDNGPLVICQDDAYHKLLHQRQRAYERRRRGV